MKVFILVAFVLSTFTVFGHGENAPGPHGGSIQMPGAFHTELLLIPDAARVYLLDMAFKNPITESSEVSITVESKKKTLAVECSAKETFFECKLPFELSTITRIKVKAVRKGLKAREASYPLPLSFNAPTDHSGHEHHH